MAGRVADGEFQGAGEGAKDRYTILLDTNVFIALEPTSPAVEPRLRQGAELLRHAREAGHKIFLSSDSLHDISRDPNVARRSANQLLAQKYLTLDSVIVPHDLLEILGEEAPPPGRHSNNDVDLSLLAVLWLGVVDLFVTDDHALRRRGVRAGLGDRILTVDEAAELFRRLAPKPYASPPAVLELRTFGLDLTDPIMESLRQDYAPFDSWIRKTFSAPGRPAWVILDDHQRYAALMIVKERGNQGEAPGRRPLKLCTFKVAPGAMGRSYGELLLKTLFGFAQKGGYDSIFVTCFLKHERLIELLGDFGFADDGPSTDNPDEHRFVKMTRPDRLAETPALEAHRAFGPPFVHPRARIFVVPVRPVWHDVLFPDASMGLDIWLGSMTFGNALRKAYVSASNTRAVGPGDILLFYRSKDLGAATVVGVVEDVRICSDTDTARRFVGRRTVYQPEDLRTMIEDHGMLHAMTFRQDRILDKPLTLADLKKNGVLNGPPQSITEVRGRGRTWMHRHLAESQ